MPAPLDDCGGVARSESSKGVPTTPAASKPLATIDLGLENVSKESEAQFEMSQLEQARAAWLAKSRPRKLLSINDGKIWIGRRYRW